jgi:hypothetical protein
LVVFTRLSSIIPPVISLGVLGLLKTFPWNFRDFRLSLRESSFDPYQSGWSRQLPSGSCPDLCMRIASADIWHLKIDRRGATVVQNFAYGLANTPHHTFSSLGFFGHATTCAIYCNTAVREALNSHMSDASCALSLSRTRQPESGSMIRPRWCFVLARLQLCVIGV